MKLYATIFLSFFSVFSMFATGNQKPAGDTGRNYIAGPNYKPNTLIIRVGAAHAENAKINTLAGEELNSLLSAISPGSGIALKKRLLSPAQALSHNPKLKMEYINRQLSKRLKGQNKLSFIPDLNKAFNIQGIEKAEEPLLRSFVIEYEGSAPPRKFAKKLLEKYPFIEIAEPYSINSVQQEPNDPQYAQQMSLQLTGLKKAWAELQNSSGSPEIIIGISDNGIFQDHEDLKNAIAKNEGEIPFDNIDNDGNGYIDDYIGCNLAAQYDPSQEPGSTYIQDNHGTLVSGIAAASTNNNLGIAGAGYNCKFFPIRGAKSGGNNVDYAYESILYAGIRGFDVLNCSWGQPQEFSIIEQSIINFAVAKGVAIVVSGGNTKPGAPQHSHYFPSYYDGVLGVGDVDNSDETTSATNFHSGLDIMAPGFGNISTNLNGSYDITKSGTSFAAPFVAGITALVRAKYPELGPLQALEHVRLSVVDIGPQNPNWVGFIPGRVDAYKALSTDPFSRPGIRPEEIMFFNVQGNPIKRYFDGDTILIGIKARNHLGAAENLTFNLSVLNDNLDIVDILESEALLPAVERESNFEIKFFKVKINSRFNARLFMRVDISLESGFKDFFLFDFIPTIDVATFEGEALKFSMADDGRIGWGGSSGNRTGVGFIHKIFGNQLYKGGLIIATEDKTVSSAPGLSSTYNFDLYKPFYSGSMPYEQILRPEKQIPVDIIQEVNIGNDNQPCALIKITLKGRNGGLEQDISAGYYLDWDVNGAYDSNFVKFFPEGAPDNNGQNNSAAQLLWYPEGPPYIGVSVYTPEENAQAQAAEYSDYDDTDYNQAWDALNSGSSIRLSQGGQMDVSHVAGMKFFGGINEGQEKSYFMKICIANTEAAVANLLKNAIVSVGARPSPKGNFSVSPNPAKDFLNISIPDSNETVAGAIYNILGAKVMDFVVESGEKINISQLPKGLYLIRAGEYSGKFTIVR